MKPEFGSCGYFCNEFFCGSGDLTFAIKFFFQIVSVQIIKLKKQRVKDICLNLTREVHKQLVTGGAASGRCLWVHFGVPCGTPLCSS